MTWEEFRSRLRCYPRVHLVARTEIHLGGMDDFLRDVGTTWLSDSDDSGDALPEVAGRVCYMSYDRPRPGGNAAYVENILSTGHGSVLEHASVTVAVTGVNRGLSHELVRHRAGTSVSQLSQRYCDEPEVAPHPDNRDAVVAALGAADAVPLEMLKQDAAAALDWVAFNAPHSPLLEEGVEYLAQCVAALDAYERQVGIKTERFRGAGLPARDLRKFARQAARDLLPNCAETKMFFTANVRAWRHVLEMRGDEAADKFIREVAVLALPKLQRYAPHCFGDYHVEEVPHYGPAIRGKFKKV